MIITLVLSTLVNIGLRWMRWYFLTRRVGAFMTSRDSLLVYTATLPAILTPVYLGEFIRPLIVAQRYPRMRRRLAGIWLYERGSDAFVLALLLAVTTGAGWIAAGAGALWLVSLALLGSDAPHQTRLPRAGTVGLSLSLTLGSWLVTSASLWLVLQILGQSVGIAEAVSSFAQGTLLGGLTGMPLGVGVTGSAVIGGLQHYGVGLAPAVLATAIFRAGTAWFSVGLGLVTALRWRHNLASLAKPQAGDHFDAIAERYQEEIPEHVRSRLLARKIAVMGERLAREGDDLHGLDIGCGQGWYACEMARKGYTITAVDQSEGQLARAREYASDQGEGLALNFEWANAAELPFPDASFDFAYAVNMIHHVTDLDVRAHVFREIARVLRPGGMFFLHEINTENPLFRFYMGYVFPLIRDIDEGTEKWIRPGRLPRVEGAEWEREIAYFTFLPDFVPSAWLGYLAPFERALERSYLRHFSAHYTATLLRK
ncbi:MAG: methyltransferase domain-containing protein [Myxococcales bacterium]|nr:methyltransferase domain-containing protein [Myxococcales bacterium]